MSTETVEEVKKSEIEVFLDSQYVEDEEEAPAEEIADTPEETVDEKPKDEPEEEAELVVAFDDQPVTEEEQKENETYNFRQLRNKVKEKDKIIAQMQEELKKYSSPAPQQLTLEKKPTLEDYDLEVEQYEAALEKWYEKKQLIELQGFEERKKKEEEEKAWQNKINEYNNGKTKFKADDFELAEEIVLNTLDRVQHNLLLDGADNPAMLTYALGKNPKRLQELAKITNPVQYVKSLLKLEMSLKTNSIKKPPAPEEKISPTGGVTNGASASEEKRLEKLARQTGDYTELFAYRKQNKKKS